jgi:cell wall-associated NlpC family hydrolase
VNKETFDHLKLRMDGYAVYLVQRAEKKFDVSPRDIVRGAFLAMLRTAPTPYYQVRPYPSSVSGFDIHGSDCSGTFTLAYKLAHDHFGSKVQDPNGLGFNGQGYTGTLDAHGTRISGSQAKPGDAAFFYSDHGHVTGYLGDGKLFSHGFMPYPGHPSPHVIGTGGVVEWRSYL